MSFERRSLIKDYLRRELSGFKITDNFGEGPEHRRNLLAENSLGRYLFVVNSDIPGYRPNVNAFGEKLLSQNEIYVPVFDADGANFYRRDKNRRSRLNSNDNRRKLRDLELVVLENLGEVVYYINGKLMVVKYEDRPVMANYSAARKDPDREGQAIPLQSELVTVKKVLDITYFSHFDLKPQSLGPLLTKARIIERPEVDSYELNILRKECRKMLSTQGDIPLRVRAHNHMIQGGELTNEDLAPSDREELLDYSDEL